MNEVAIIGTFFKTEEAAVKSCRRKNKKHKAAHFSVVKFPSGYLVTAGDLIE